MNAGADSSTWDTVYPTDCCLGCEVLIEKCTPYTVWPVRERPKKPQVLFTQTLTEMSISHLYVRSTWGIQWSEFTSVSISFPLSDTCINVGALLPCICSHRFVKQNHMLSRQCWGTSAELECSVASQHWFETCTSFPLQALEERLSWRWQVYDQL